ncbi:hypothetical protein K0M31_008229 [Melipona bicolor]|uniref:Uncharacterized protein n=1 Tax=Melipona bicolor TaxID=60889 RepID=A0AA40FRB2_9HYME|nr:hypothetical protein K0M31_008229 [Melipona bicolor]
MILDKVNEFLDKQGAESLKRVLRTEISLLVRWSNGWSNGIPQRGTSCRRAAGSFEPFPTPSGPLFPRTAESKEKRSEEKKRGTERTSGMTRNPDDTRLSLNRPSSESHPQGFVSKNKVENRESQSVAIGLSDKYSRRSSCWYDLEEKGEGSPFTPE